MRSDSVDRLREIDAAIAEIASFTAGRDEAAYMSDSLLRSAVLWQLVRICEAVRVLARSELEVAQGIGDYREITAFRTLLIHEYAKVRHSEVWRYVQADLPTLQRDVEALLDAPDS